MNQHELIILDDPLALNIKRPKLPKYVLNSTVQQPGRALGKYTLNWLAARSLTQMLERVFTSKEPQFKAVRQALRELGVNVRPRELHFKVLREIELVYPGTISKTKLATYLNIDRDELDQMLTYLRDFGALTVGVSILPDGRGQVGIASLDLWISYQNMLTAQQVKLQRTKELHGAAEVAQARHVHIQAHYPVIQPELFALSEGDEKSHASD